MASVMASETPVADLHHEKDSLLSTETIPTETTPPESTASDDWISVSIEHIAPFCDCDDGSGICVFAPQRGLEEGEEAVGALTLDTSNASIEACQSSAADIPLPPTPLQPRFHGYLVRCNDQIRKASTSAADYGLRFGVWYMEARQECKNLRSSASGHNKMIRDHMEPIKPSLLTYVIIQRWLLRMATSLGFRSYSTLSQVYVNLSLALRLGYAIVVSSPPPASDDPKTSNQEAPAGDLGGLIENSKDQKADDADQSAPSPKHARGLEHDNWSKMAFVNTRGDALILSAIVIVNLLELQLLCHDLSPKNSGCSSSMFPLICQLASYLDLTLLVLLTVVFIGGLVHYLATRPGVKPSFLHQAEKMKSSEKQE